MQAFPLILVLAVGLVAAAQAQTSSEEHEDTAFVQFALQRQTNELYSLRLKIGNFFRKFGKILAKIGRILQTIASMFVKAGDMLVGGLSGTEYRMPRLAMWRLVRKLKRTAASGLDERLVTKVFADILAETARNTKIPVGQLKMYLVSRLNQVSAHLIKEGRHYNPVPEDPKQELEVGLQVVAKVVVEV